MSRKTLFFLSSDNFHAHIWKNGTLTNASYFANNAEGLQQFAVFLETHHDPAYILVDLIEEDFRHEVVPHLTGSNHQALINRKFDQYYRSTPFRLARRQQRQTEGRRDDQILFSALTNPARISAWLDLLLLHKIPIVGIYSLPHASTPLLKHLDDEQMLLLSWEKDAGLRQSYYLNKHLRFSRLTPLPPGSNFANAVTIETARTYQYLQSLSLTPQAGLLKVHIICHTSDRAELDERLSGNKYMLYSYLDLQQLGMLIKSQDIYENSDATKLFLHLLATQPPQDNYAEAEQTHYYQLWQTQRGLFGLAAVTALTCLLWSAFSLWEGSEARSGIAENKTQTVRMLEQAQQITRKFSADTQNAFSTPGSYVPASDMKSAVTVFRKLQHYAEPPELILKSLTTTLNNLPRIRTSKIAWQTSSPTANNLSSNYPVQIVTFNGELADFGNDYRAALDYLERFQVSLKRAGYIVTPVKLPLDFSPQGSIGANIGESRVKPSEFTLKIIWRQAE